MMRAAHARRSVTQCCSAGVALGLCLLVARSASAADQYVCDCGAEADADCVAGSDAADGLSPETAWQSYDQARNSFAGLAAGDAIRFCRGGALSAENGDRWVAPGCT